jgi:hypothetical protein
MEENFGFLGHLPSIPLDTSLGKWSWGSCLSTWSIIRCFFPSPNSKIHIFLDSMIRNIPHFIVNCSRGMGSLDDSSFYPSGQNPGQRRTSFYPMMHCQTPRYAQINQTLVSLVTSNLSFHRHLPQPSSSRERVCMEVQWEAAPDQE